MSRSRPKEESKRGRKTSMMKNCLKLALSLATLLIFSLFALNTHADVPKFSRVVIQPNLLEPLQVGEVQIQLTIPPDFKAFGDQFKIEVLEPLGFKFTSVKVTPLKKHFDRFSKSEREVLTGTGSLLAAFEAPENIKPGKQVLKIRVHFQTCSETYCNFPNSSDIEGEFEVANQATSSDSSEGLNNNSSLQEFPWANAKLTDIFKFGTFWTFIFIFIFGVLTSFTPCIFPMIPITLTVLGKDVGARSRKQSFLAALIYVLGISLTYALLGLFAASSGVLFGSLMTNPFVLGFVCLVFLAMALSMFGLYELQAPRFIRESRLATEHHRGYSGVFVYGITAGIIASPCVGPILVGILTYVAQTKDLLFGFWLLFTYSMGMGSLFIALGMSSRLINRLPKSGQWMVGIKHFFGLLMMGAFFYYFQLLSSERIFDGTLGIGLVIWASVFGAFADVKTIPIWGKVKKGLLQAILIIGIIYISIAIFNLRPFMNNQFVTTEAKQNNILWTDYSDQAFQEAINSQRPIIIDFFADWCAACHELEEKTFTDPRVQVIFSQFALLRFDATKDSPKLNELRKKYEIMGLPTIIFINSKGQWSTKNTLTSFEEPLPFIRRLEKVLKE